MLQKEYIVIGLGKTGGSCVHYLMKQGHPVVVMDTREHPPLIDEIKQRYPTLDIFTNEQWPIELLKAAKALVVSPGVSVQHPLIEMARHAGVEIIGDVELFTRFNSAPIVAITGSNGKSTVTTLVGNMAQKANKKVCVIGNIGRPVLDALEQPDYDLVVMELSSFQLETTYHLSPFACVVLNITPDHMDRYASFEDYIAAKHRIHQNAKNVIINKEEPYSFSEQIPSDAKKYWVTECEPTEGEWGLRVLSGEKWLAFGTENLISESELKIVGKHNLVNALNALALGSAIGLPVSAMLEALREFTGLEHRCQWVADKNNVRWINDSKGTNVGATQAALIGLGQEHKKIVLILGGDGKGADFSELREPIERYCRAIVVKGKDAKKILLDLADTVRAIEVNTMKEAVQSAADVAEPGDTVLLSPACASLDQYRDYVHRGEVFIAAVRDR